MDFDKLIKRFSQFGGLRLVRHYSRLGLIPIIVKSFFRCLLKKQSFKRIYSDVLKRVEPFLEQKYQPLLGERKRYYSDQSFEHAHPSVIWFCWLQGFEQAPPIVHACYNSLKQYLPERNINLIDNNNWRDYVDLPDDIVRKWNKNEIPPANFSDLLRLQLLIRYGGSWIDATVLCTGTEHTRQYLDADLFVFQYTRPGAEWTGDISNWFISAHSNHPMLMALRDMLFDYWHSYDCTLDYYIFHLFFAMLAKEYPQVISSMPYGYSVWSITLMHHWKEPFDEVKWKRLISRVSFHKLSYRVSESTKKDSSNYFNYILSQYAS